MDWQRSASSKTRVWFRLLTNVVNTLAEKNVGSIQQSILGVFCIAIAFMLGHYIRNHPSPESLEQQRNEQVAATSVPSFAFGSASSTDVTSSAKPSVKLPAPSEGFGTGLTESVAAQPIATEPLATRDAAPVRAEREIDIPDFSQLAASFKNTPLALPESGFVNSASPTLNRIAPKPQTHSGSFYVRSNADQNLPAADDRPDVRNFPAGKPAFAGSRAEPVAPPQPIEMYELNDQPTSFRREDFQPRLISKETSSRNQAIAVKPNQRNQFAVDGQSKPLNQRTNRRISLAPPEPDEPQLMPEIPDLEVTMPPESRSDSLSDMPSQLVRNDRPKNQLHSYYDVGTTDSSRSVLDRTDFQRSASTTPTKNRRIPFGLNEQGKRELTRIQSRQQTNVSLQTDRFSQHTTRTGDTLQSLSVEYYGKPDFYLDIYLANQQSLKNPAVIPAGVQLRIPKYGQ